MEEISPECLNEGMEDLIAFVAHELATSKYSTGSAESFSSGKLHKLRLQAHNIL